MGQAMPLRVSIAQQFTLSHPVLGGIGSIPFGIIYFKLILWERSKYVNISLNIQKIPNRNSQYLNTS